MGQNLAANSYPVVLASDQPAIPASPAAATSGGLTPHSRLSTADANATSVKAAAGQVYEVVVGNTSASPRYLKLYDLARAPVPASDTPVQRYTIPGSTTGAGFAKSFGTGLQFTNGIAYVLVGGSADSDATAVGAAECTINLGYK